MTLGAVMVDWGLLEPMKVYVGPIRGCQGLFRSTKIHLGSLYGS